MPQAKTQGDVTFQPGDVVRWLPPKAIRTIPGVVVKVNEPERHAMIDTAGARSWTPFEELTLIRRPECQ